ncbi:hypothetical protein FA95DRAFT_713950 [Auriscalpium vulgare]|uniref:Uncharacterized protein n=1 Tax=Auriscalpium vulgare TaxID=40419 RepID=A0ACB8RB37_9AGAM|nr:hypothetical protein FA95DRAFT_713950 [Auriscalpium vulgare]
MLSLSTGERHPSAFLDAGKEIRNCLDVEVFGDYCAAASWEYKRPCVTVWSWKTRSTDVKLFPPQPSLGTRRLCFTFLDGAHIAVTAYNPPVILVYSFDVEQTEYLPTTFTLPPDAIIRYGPSLSPCATVTTSGDHAGIFFPAPTRHMLTLSFILQSTMHRFLLNIPAATLLAQLHDAPAVVEWTNWGPAGSRLSPSPKHPRSGACGVRLAYETRVGSDSAPVAVTMLADYRPSRVEQARKCGVGRLVEEATEAPDKGISGLSEARLPYVEKEFMMPGPEGRYKAILCEDQLFVFEESHTEGRHSFVRAWACTI